METRHISTKVSSHFRYTKAGSGPAVLLIHGFPERGSLWGRVGEQLAKNFTVLIPDIPGAGDSTLEQNDVSLEEVADCVKALLDHEGITRVVIVGHSMGGYISLAFAAKYPSMLAGVSLVHSTATADTEEKKETRRRAINLVKRGGKRPFIQQMVPGLFSEQFKATHPEVIKEQVERGVMLNDESIIAFYNAMINRPDSTRTLKEANWPVQWILGKEDNVIPLSSALQQSKLASVNFVTVYPACGHMSMIERPDELSDDLKEFCGFCHKEN